MEILKIATCSGWGSPTLIFWRFLKKRFLHIFGPYERHTAHLGVFGAKNRPKTPKNDLKTRFSDSKVPRVAPRAPKMDAHGTYSGLIWRKMAQKCPKIDPKRPNLTKIAQKRPENDQKTTKMYPLGFLKLPRVTPRPKMDAQGTYSGLIWRKMGQKCPKIDPKRLNLAKIAQNDQKTTRN